MLNTRIITIALSLMLMLGMSLTVSAEINEDMIAAAWLFDGDAEDVSGNGFDGEVKGGKFVAGKIGDALELNGSDEWVEIPKRSANLKKLPSRIGSNPQDVKEHGVCSSMSTVGKQGISITRCTRIIKLSSPFTVTGWERHFRELYVSRRSDG